MELFGRASWLMFAAGALPTGLAGWWIGSRAGAVPPWALGLMTLAAAAFSCGAALLAWRWFAAPLRELERGLERWTRGDLTTPLDGARMGGWPGLARQFARAQGDLRRSLDEAHADLAHERARLQTLIETLPDALIVAGSGGGATYLNAPAMALLGAGAADVRPGGRALFATREPERWRDGVRRLSPASAGGSLVEVQGPGGAVFSYRALTAALGAEATGDFGTLLMLRDVTAERRLDALKEEFLQAAAHDLRAPLFAVQGYLRLLRKSMTPDARQGPWFDAIDTSCAKLSLFVKDALDAARIEDGRLPLAPGPVDPRALLERTAALFRPVADERGVALEAAVAAGAPASFEADERLIERLLHNLIGNALKFTPRGGRVAVSAEARGAELELSVEDDGPGIPESQRAAVFERFRQLESSGPKTGFGLGLSICARIVKLHGGTIWVEPGRANGSRFVARLPLARLHI